MIKKQYICWLIIGIVLGIVISCILFYVDMYLPKLTEIQRTGVGCVFCGIGIGYMISKLEW